MSEYDYEHYLKRQAAAKRGAIVGLFFSVLVFVAIGLVAWRFWG